MDKTNIQYILEKEKNIEINKRIIGPLSLFHQFIHYTLDENMIYAKG
ncbi:putative ORFan [Tupanvirus deep ocean]|uniref:ORFan n=2 Tax=Tupanvirus TaxID=2094720 RepID=A0AC62A718_9VIRU|nr:putative ORFan [Tupanvirus deep ocean]QKU33574.1 putative ORFan [Tupanvirus deep ocean]